MKRRPNKEPRRKPQPIQQPAGPGIPKSRPEPESPARKWVFRLIALALVPLLLLGGLEVVLRIAGYGYSTRLFKPLRIGQDQFLVENDQFSLRFFPPELARTPGPIRMKSHKPAGTYRIFILGESAAMGDPEPAFGAGRYLEVLLRERYPEAKFELVNVAFTAINSHVILPIARECATHEGDLWIIYMGNNEMVGPFGAATIFGPQAPPIALVRVSLALQQTRLGQALAALGRRLKGKSSSPSAWGGMQMFLGNQVPPNAPRKEAVYWSFQKNLLDILRASRNAGARIILNTVAVNLKDCPPFASAPNTNLPAADRARFEQLFREATSLEGRGQFAEAAGRFEQAARLDALSADLEFHWANCLMRLTNATAARPHFQAACDLDALPFRADSRLNDLIADASRQSANPKLVLCDAAAWLATNSPSLIPGQETFYEHVHFNFDGNYRLALGWAAQVTQYLPAAMTRGAAADWATQAVCERRLGLTDWNRTIVVEGVLRRMRQPPLSAQNNNARRMADLQSWASDLRQRMDMTGAAKAREVYVEALRNDPHDYCLYENFASFLVGVGDIDGAAAQWRQVHELIPQDYLAEFRLGELLAGQGKFAEAQAFLSEAAARRPFISDPWFELGKLHLAESKLDLALQELARARKLRPTEADYCYQTGRALALLNRRAEAIDLFREAIRLNSSHWLAHDALGGMLGLDGSVAAARAEFEQVVRLQPAYARAHLNLGVALLKQGQSSGAALEFQEALRLEPTNTVARDYLRQAQPSQ